MTGICLISHKTLRFPYIDKERTAWCRDEPSWPGAVGIFQGRDFLNGSQLDAPNSTRTGALAVNNLGQIVGDFIEPGIGIVFTDMTDFVLLDFFDTTPLPIMLRGMR